MEHISAFIISMGIPSAICGLIFWWFKKWMEKREAKAEERDKNIETLMLLIMKETRATNVLAKATAEAVQRIPDAHCNGDMTAALKRADEIQQEEKDFLVDNGIKRIFGD